MTRAAATRGDSAAPRWLSAGQRLALMLALAGLPFELVAGLRVGPLTLTNVELLLLAALGLWAALLAVGRQRPAVPRWLAVGAAALVLTLLLSAGLAGAERAAALKFALRQAQGALLALCVADTLRRGASPALLAGALLAGAGLSAALGLAEISELPAVMAALSPFKTESSYMGGLLRLSATFGYANTAAQFYEALLPFSVLAALAPLVGDRGQGTGDRAESEGQRAEARGEDVGHGEIGARAERGRPRAALFPAPFALSAILSAILFLAAMLTYSRAALLVLAALLALAPLAAWWLAGVSGLRRVGALCGGLAALGLALAIGSPTFRLRVTEPEVAGWFGARYEVAPIEPMAPNELRSVPVTVVNSGRIRWEHRGLRPVSLSYHWIEATTGSVARFEGRRSLLPGTVAPGASVELLATLQAPARPGRYVLVWDMVREHIGRGWFSQMGVAPARVHVEVTGEAAADVAPPAPERPATAASIAPQRAPPGRSELWGVALSLWRERPLLGIGPDVFRHIYGPRLGLSIFDDRIHTNNLYIELLAGAGVVGLGAFLWLAGTALLEGWGQLRRVNATEHGLRGVALLGAMLGVVAFLIHGLLDVFLAFTATGALLWALLGVIGGTARFAGRRDRNYH